MTSSSPSSGQAGTRRLRDRIRAVPWLVTGAPRWVVAVLGVGLAGAGLFLLVRPLTAVQVLGLYVAVSCLASGIADLVTPRAAERRLQLATGGLWILAGLTGLAWWGRDADLFAPAVAVVLLLSGAIHLLRFAVRRAWDTSAAALLGLAEVLFGVLALTWPDATMIVIGALFGGRTVGFGLTLLTRALGGGRPRERSRGVVSVVGAGLVLLVAIGATWTSHALRDGALVLDGFYATPGTLPARPGVLIRTSSYDGDLPPGMTGRRIYYTTTDASGVIVPSSGILAVPERAGGPMPLVTWSHGTVGIARACAPSNGPHAFEVGQEPAAERFAALGWAFVASDYPGMGAEGATPYLIGQGEGRAVLDAARAARQVSGLSFADQTVVWGHSQGGHGALWAGQLAPGYAPDLDVVGTAALSPASNPRALAAGVIANTGAPGATLGIGLVVMAYAGYYPDVSLETVAPAGGRTLIREAASRCTSEGGTLVTILSGLTVGRDALLIRPSALDGPLGKRLDENIPAGPWSAPLFIGQGEADEVIAYRINENFVAGLCSRDADVEFRGYPGGTHMSVLEEGSRLSSDVVAWTQDRLAGRPSTPSC